MWGIPTIQKLNSEATDAAEIMKRKGYEQPDFKAAAVESVANGRVETHVHIPLGQTPAERIALANGEGIGSSD
jgi:hypothetical protein